jgi:hypothetical protein
MVSIPCEVLQFIRRKNTPNLQENSLFRRFCCCFTHKYENVFVFLIVLNHYFLIFFFRLLPCFKQQKFTIKIISQKSKLKMLYLISEVISTFLLIFILKCSAFRNKWQYTQYKLLLQTTFFKAKRKTNWNMSMNPVICCFI